MLRSSSNYQSIDVCCPRPTSAANPPTAAAAVDRRDRQTDGQTLDRFMTLAAFCADRVIKLVYGRFKKSELTRTVHI